MSYRVPTFEELFPLSYSKQLLDIQSTHFVNNSLAKGVFTAGLEGIPTTIPTIESLSNEMAKDKITKSLVGNYIKNNWKVMLTCAIVGGTLIYILYKIDEGNRKKRTRK
jgi:hypothetical protein